MSSELHLLWWPQRDLNPCYRLERSGRGVSGIFDQWRIGMATWANALECSWLALSILGSDAAQTRFDQHLPLRAPPVTQSRAHHRSN